MTDHNPVSAGNVISKLLAAFDLISGFTIFAVAVAATAVLTLPSPLFGIDLAPVRTGLTGAAIASAAILASCLVVAKVARAAYVASSTKTESGNARPVLVISQNMSFWQGNQSPAGPVIQVHLQGLLTNPNLRRGFMIARIALFRLTPFGIFSARECLNFAIGEAGPFDLHKVHARSSVRFRVDHMFAGKYPLTQRHLWIGVLLVDQRGRRYRKLVRLRHAKTPLP